MDAADKVYLKDRLGISVQVLSLTSPTTALVRVAWSNHGILDVDEALTHTVSVSTDQGMVSNYPATYTNLEAFEAKYSTVVTGWEVFKNHRIDVDLGSGVTTRLDVLPFYSNYSYPKLTTTRLHDLRTRLLNTDLGVKVSISGCSNCASDIANIKIERGPKDLSSFSTVAVSTVSTSVTASSDINDYSSIHWEGSSIPVTSANSTTLQTHLTNILADLSECVLLSEHTPLRYPVVGVQEVRNIKEGDYSTVPTLDTLDSITIDVDKMYYVTSEDTYYKYTSEEVMYPAQPIQEYPSIDTTWTALSGITSSSLTGGVYIHGNNSSTSPADIKLAAKDTKGNYTGYAQVASATDMLPLLPSLSEFMTYKFRHTDTSVNTAVTYAYKVTVTTFDGSEQELPIAYISHYPLLVSGLPTNTTLANLNESYDKDRELVEEDFQSGTTPDNLMVTLSDSPDDYKLYLKYLEESSKGLCLR